MNEILIIPDIHGRGFWKEYASDFSSFSHVVCLGDYFDPYPSDGISELEAIDNFRQLVSALSVLPEDRKTLLIGNHDAHYINGLFDDQARCTRKSYEYEDEIASLILAHVGYLLAWQCELKGKTFLISHAGVGAIWLSRHCDLLPTLDANALNRLTDSEEGWNALSDVGSIRGGFSVEGSPLWCDVSELQRDEMASRLDYFPFQIVGHTRQSGHAIIGEHFACIDTRQCYILYQDGSLAQL